MKKFIIKISLFTLFIPFFWIVSVTIFGYLAPISIQKNIVYRPISYGHMHTRLSELEKINDKPDIIVFGSSHAYRGVDPRIFDKNGVTLFNMGSSSQTPIQSLALAEIYLDHLNPKTVLIEVFPSTFSSDGVESSIDLLSNSPFMHKSYNKMVFSVNKIKIYNTLIYAYANNFIFKKKYFEDTIKGEDKYVSGGFVEKVISKHPPETKFKPHTIVFNPKQKKAFSSFINFIKSRNIKIVIFQSPITVNRYNSIENSKQIDSYFESFCDDKNVVYFNFNNMLKFDNTYFYDSHHLNQKGVETFNQSLLNFLFEENLIDTYP
ncbi:MAG: hypothetical protein ACK4K0_08140 [Flavobacteriales bacterium]